MQTENAVHLDRYIDSLFHLSEKGGISWFPVTQMYVQYMVTMTINEVNHITGLHHRNNKSGNLHTVCLGTVSCECGQGDSRLSGLMHQRHHITMTMPWALIQLCSTPICMVQCTHLITTGGTPHLYNRGSSMLVNSLHSGEKLHQYCTDFLHSNTQINCFFMNNMMVLKAKCFDE